MQYILLIMLVFLSGCRKDTEPYYKSDGKLYVNNYVYTGSITVRHGDGYKWTGAEYKDGVLQKIVEWDKKGSVVSELSIIPEDFKKQIQWQWEHHRRHLSEIEDEGIQELPHAPPQPTDPLN
jgi:hypothetical protein